MCRVQPRAHGSFPFAREVCVKSSHWNSNKKKKKKNSNYPLALNERPKAEDHHKHNISYIWYHRKWIHDDDRSFVYLSRLWRGIKFEMLQV
jgi:hypothetical protein